MPYSVIQPPFTLDFRTMSRRELVAYARWFHSTTPERVSQLEGVVRGSTGFEAWRADCSPESLESLGRWFASRVVPVAVNGVEGPQERASMEVEATPLDALVLSFSIDIGMYFALVLLRAQPKAKWDQSLKDRRFIDYGQPVLLGLGSVPLNPVRIMINVAYGLRAGQYTASRLRELFDVWMRFGSSQREVPTG